MKLSIIIVSYCTVDLLVECIDSILKNGPTCSHEIIVVDNASNDGSADKVSSKYPAVQLICNQNNLGFAQANNQAIRLAQGNYVLLLNSDAKLRKDSIDRMLEYIQCNPAVGALGCRILNSDGSWQNSYGNFPSLRTELHHKIFDRIFPGGGFTFSQHIEREFSNITTVDWITAACMLLPKNVLDDLGGFDEMFFMYLEDTDLCYRIHKKGYQVQYFPGASVTHGRSQSAQRYRTDFRFVQLATVSRYIYFNKHYGFYIATIVGLLGLLRSIVRYLTARIGKMLNRITSDDTEDILRLRIECLVEFRLMRRWRDFLVYNHTISDKEFNTLHRCKL